MKHYISILLLGIIFSMFFFPFGFADIPIDNSKNLVGALGLIFLFLIFVFKKELILSKEVLILFILSGFVSLVSLFSVVYNHTPDYSYVTYIRSALIWFCGALVLCSLVRYVHGEISVQLIVNYLIAICIFQCIMAMLIYYIPGVQRFVDAHFLQDQQTLHQIDRLYGIGASLDVAGSRFSVVLAAISVLLFEDREKMSQFTLFVYIVAFMIITIIGNMIARTTLVGVVVGFGFIGLQAFLSLIHGESVNFKLFRPFLLVSVIIIPIAILLYNTSDSFRDLIRFGFEGFFNWVERGEWSVGSNETLKSMLVFPETLKTWIIGDGYFMNSRFDENFLGEANDVGFYMGTDIGYLRFIFYFGLIGLASISAVMLYAAVIGAKYFPDHKWVPLLGGFINFIIWLKVSTDVFPFLILFVSASLISSLFPSDEEDQLEE